MSARHTRLVEILTTLVEVTTVSSTHLAPLHLGSCGLACGNYTDIPWHRGWPYTSFQACHLFRQSLDDHCCLYTAV
jgi:hypothetical protein